MPVASFHMNCTLNYEPVICVFHLGGGGGGARRLGFLGLRLGKVLLQFVNGSGGGSSLAA